MLHDYDEDSRQRVRNAAPSRKALMTGVSSHLFEMAVENGYDLSDFINKFMTSDTAFEQDIPLTHYEWEGEDYIWDDFIAECEAKQIFLARTSVEDTSDTMQIKDIAAWIGYIYKTWHYMTGETSSEIVAKAPADVMIASYGYGHTQDPDGWIEDYIGNMQCLNNI